MRKKIASEFGFGVDRACKRFVLQTFQWRRRFDGNCFFGNGMRILFEKRVAREIRNRHAPRHDFCRLVSTVIGCAGYAFQLGDTPDIALATSVLYLVPGILYINALSDLLNGAFLSCIRHAFNATILTICLSIGFSLGLISTNLHFF